jgi:oligopeptide/dipeptide ABC transporter ATP-binding protein
VADEPVSSLDVSIRAQILNLLCDIQRELDLSCLYISHDLSSVRQISHRVAVMYLGRIVELAATEELFNHIRHPYAKALIAAVPAPDPRTKADKIVLPGEVPSPINPPSGCRFHPRCKYAEPRCRQESPQLEGISSNHWVACHRYDEIASEPHVVGA